MINNNSIRALWKKTLIETGKSKIRNVEDEESEIENSCCNIKKEGVVRQLFTQRVQFFKPLQATKEKEKVTKNKDDDITYKEDILSYLLELEKSCDLK